jgi:primosomal replication protein N
VDNCLVMSGRVVKSEPARYSPAGLPITRLVLDHQSEQLEAGFPREARCRIAVAVCGEPLNRQIDGLAVGSEIRVSGFISRVSHRHSESRLILHAQKIEFLSS